MKVCTTIIPLNLKDKFPCYNMSRSLAILISGSLLLFVGATSDTSSNTQLVSGASEQYCFTRPEEPPLAQDVPFMITVIYSGVTLSTTAAAHTMCEIGPTSASSTMNYDGDLSPSLPTPTSIDLDGSGNCSTVIPLDSEMLSPTSGDVAATGSEMPSPTPGDLAAGSNTSSGAFGAPSTGQDTQITSATMTSLATDLGIVSSTKTGEHISVDNTRISSRTISSQLPIVTETGQNIVSSTGDVAQSASNGSRSSVLLNGSSAASLGMSSSAKSSLGESMHTDVQPSATASPGVPMSTSTLSLIPVSPSSSIGVGTQNETLELSPAAVEALRLAQFLKNLGAAALNTSSWPSGPVYTSLADLLAEFFQAGLFPTSCSNVSANLAH
jgi:hypothetical protein